jgi:hypothetical protein
MHPLHPSIPRHWTKQVEVNGIKFHLIVPCF